MYKILFLNLLSCYCILSLFSIAFSQSFISSGTVKDKDGAIIVKAKISVLSSNGTVLQETFTNGEGHFSFKALADVPNTLMFVADGFDRQLFSAVKFTMNELLLSATKPTRI